jgi:hypothetical protein
MYDAHRFGWIGTRIHLSSSPFDELLVALECSTDRLAEQMG